jgi:hypothetical protein
MACKTCQQWQNLYNEWRKKYEQLEKENERNKEVARALSIKLANIESGDDHK